MSRRPSHICIPLCWRRSRKLTASGALISSLVCLTALLTACAHHPGLLVPETRNIYSAHPVLPPDMKRLALLPLAISKTVSNPDYANETFGPLLQTEMGKTGKFEFRPADPRTLRIRTGASSWSVQDPLPQALFQMATNEMGCDALLLPEVTCFQAYPNIVIGWRMRIVDPSTGFTLWAVDEVFDSSFDGSFPLQSASQPTPVWLTRTSPRLFAKFSLESVFATLPAR